MLTIGVPSGIGDVSWMYSKLKNVGFKMNWEIADGWPHRTKPYLELLPEIETVDYGAFNYTEIIKFGQLMGIDSCQTWEEVVAKDFGRILIQANRHLELGKRLENWLPDLDCDFHYEINVNEEDKKRAWNKVAAFPKPWMGISAASYRGSEAWKTWGYEEWSPFLKALHAEVGGTIFLIGGFWDDLTDTLSDDGWPSLVGKTSVGSMVELMNLLDYYLGFSSGMGVIRTVLKKNAFLLWPDFQTELSTSWAPPWMLEKGTYMAQPWRDPAVVIKRVRNWLRCIEK